MKRHALPAEFGNDLNDDWSKLLIVDKNRPGELLIHELLQVDSKSGLVQHPRLIDPNNTHLDVKSISPRVKEILALDPSYAHVTTQESHLSALLAAVLIQDEEAVDLILDNNADPDVADGEGRTPLWWAARLGNTAIVSSLMSFGASIEAVAAPPVLHLAVISQRRSTVLAILRHPNLDINRPDKKQRTALHYAATLKNSRILKLMFDVEEINVFARDNRGMTPLFYAALYGRVKNVRMLVNEGFFVYEQINRNEISMNPTPEGQLSSLIISDPVDNHGMTPLLWACWSGQLEVVAILCMAENGYSAADPKARDLKGRSSLHFAVLGLQKALAQKSLKRAMRIVDSIQILTRSGADAAALDHYDRTALHLLISQLPALDHDQISLVLKVVDLLVQSGTPLRKQNRFGLTAMQLTAQSGHVTLLKHVFSKIGKIDNSSLFIDAQGRPLLHHVVFGLKNQKSNEIHDAQVDFPQCMQFLLDNGVSAATIDRKGKTALQLAVQYGLASLTKVLIERADEIRAADLLQLFFKGRRHTTESLQLLLDKIPGNIGTKEHWSVLTAAAKYLFDEQCWQILSRKIEVNDGFLSLLANDPSILHVAAKSGNKPFYDWLFRSIEKEKLSPLLEKVDHRSNTVLHLAFKHGIQHNEDFKPLIELLLATCPSSVIVMKNNRGKTVLHYAAQWTTSYVDPLVTAGIDVNARDNNGVTPLHEAVACGHMGTITSLIINQAEVTIVDFKLRTVFHWLAYWSHKNNYDGTSVLDTLLALDLAALSVVESVDINGQTPLHYLACYGTHDLALFSKLMGQSRDVLDGNGESALHLASRFGHSNIVQELLNTQMNVNIFNQRGMTALMVAARYGKYPIVQQLIDHFADIHVQDNHGRTALHWAVHGKDLACISLVWADDLGSVEDNSEMMPIDIAWQQNNAMSFMKLENLINKTERIDSDEYDEEEEEEDAVNVIFDEDDLMNTDDDSDSEDDSGDSDEEDGDKQFDALFSTDFLADLDNMTKKDSEDESEGSSREYNDRNEDHSTSSPISVPKLDHNPLMETPNSTSSGLTPTVPSPRLLRASGPEISIIGSPREGSPLPTDGSDSLSSPRMKRTDSNSRFSKFAMPTYMSTFMKKFTPEGGENSDEASSTLTGDSSPKLSTSPGLGDSSDNLQIASVSLVKQMIDHEINEKVKLIREEFDKKIQEAISAETSKLMAHIKVQHEKVEDLLQQQKKDLDELSTEPNSNKASLDKLNNHINMTSQLLDNMNLSNDTNKSN